jgi:hypothetical protein
MENNINEIELIRLRLVSVLTDSFYINKPKSLHSIKDGTDFEFTITPLFGFNFEKGEVKTTIDVRTKFKETKEEVSSLVINFIFQLENLKDFIEGEISEGFKVKDSLLKLLIGTSVSTARGVLIEKYAGTYLQRTILPIIDVNTFFKSQKKQL